MLLVGMVDLVVMVEVPVLLDNQDQVQTVVLVEQNIMMVISHQRVYCHQE